MGYRRLRILEPLDTAGGMNRLFSGGVFAKQLAGGRSGASARLSHGELKVDCAEGEMLHVPLANATIELGGASGRMVFVRNEDRSVTFYTEDRDFLEELSRVAPRSVQAGIEQIRRSRSLRRRFLAYGLAGALLLVVGLVYSLPLIWSEGLDRAVDALPFSVDEKVGQVALSSMDLGGRVVKTKAVIDPVRSIIEHLEEGAMRKDVPFEIRVVENSAVNAFALPGGPMVVFTGLLRQAERPEEVAGVLAHEMAHVTERHGLERIAQSLGVVAAVQLLVGDAAGLLAVAAELFTVAAVNRYSQQQESEADRVAVHMLHAVGLDPMALADFFEDLEEEESADLDGFSWLSTHPDHDARIEQITQVLAELPKGSPRKLNVDWNNLKDALESPRTTEQNPVTD